MHPNEIKLFIKAKTPEELVRKMHDNNTAHGCGFIYDSPSFVKNEWIVWFTVDVLAYMNKENGRKK